VAAALYAVPVADSDTLTIFADVNVGAVLAEGGAVVTGAVLLPLPPPPQADKAITERHRRARRVSFIKKTMHLHMFLTS
jgi:hypothetical protein